MATHYTHPYLLNPEHKITVDLVGLGGTGCQALTKLACINSALIGTGHPGLHLTAWDPDSVSPANMGRQLFSSADLGQNKATVLITRINRFFGFEWEAVAEPYTVKHRSNILITCVDTARARVKIAERLKTTKKRGQGPYDMMLYWLDMGNLQTTGQVILGTLDRIPQGKTAGKATLPNVVRKFPQIKRIKEKDQGPSCSLADALEKQDLFINPTVADFGCGLIWKLFREGQLRFHGAFINLQTYSVNPIKIS